MSWKGRIIMSAYVITISREFGSGGREIGEKLADSLGIRCYDKSIITLAADKSGLSPEYIEKAEESIFSPFLHNLTYSSFSTFDAMAVYEAPTSDKMFLAQSAVIKELAAAGSCVIVGRCGDYVLRDNPNILKLFITGKFEDRVARAVSRYKLPPEKADAAVKKTDKSRANYYKYYTNLPWGDVNHFDLVINTSYSGIDGAVEAVKALLRHKGLS